MKLTAQPSGSIAGALLWAAVLGNSLAGSSWAESATTDPLGLQEVLRPPLVTQAVLDPEGRRVAAVLRDEREGTDRGSSLWVRSLDETTEANVGRLMRSRVLTDVSWSKDGQVLFLEAGQSLGRISADGGRPSWIYRLDPERQQTWVAVDPVLPRHVLIREVQPAAEAGSPEVHRLLRVDDRGRSETVFESPWPIMSWLLDDDGRPAWIKELIRNDSGDVEAQGLFRRALFLRDGGSRAERQAEELVRCSVNDVCGFESRAGSMAWFRSHLDEDRWSLWSVDLATREIRRAHQDPEGLADLGRLAVDPRTGRPLLASYETDRLKPYGLDPVSERHARKIRERFPRSSVEVQARADGPFWLIREQAARLHHVRHWAYGTADGSFREVLVEERLSGDPISEDRLVDQIPVTYPASDGLEIHGYVWLPRVADLSKAPTIAHIHGGPWNRVHHGFSSTAQFFASRGYVVFQPNFRGSSGYGFRYKSAARGELSRSRVQQDISDGLDHLSAKGWGAADRRAMVGHSYGGYASLVAGVYRPSEYRAVVASAPPIDLVRSFLDMDPEESTRNGMTFKRWARDLFVDFDDPEALAEERRRAPEAAIESLGVPLLLMAGGKDVKIDIVDVKHFASVARDHGKDLTFLVDDEAGHSFRTPNIREATMDLMERFLAVHLGVPSTLKGAQSSDLESYLDENLLVIGHGMGH